jgi:hypothetical protein
VKISKDLILTSWNQIVQFIVMLGTIMQFPTRKAWKFKFLGFGELLFGAYY